MFFKKINKIYEPLGGSETERIINIRLLITSIRNESRFTITGLRIHIYGYRIDSKRQL